MHPDIHQEHPSKNPLPSNALHILHIHHMEDNKFQEYHGIASYYTGKATIHYRNNLLAHKVYLL